MTKDQHPGLQIGASARRLRCWCTGLLAAACLVIAGCGGGDGPAGVASADPSPAAGKPHAGPCHEHVYATVERVRVHSKAIGWLDLPLTPPRRIDLTRLSGGVLHALGLPPLPVGTYGQLRLVLSSEGAGPELAHAVQPVGSGPVPLRVPGGGDSGLKLKGEFAVTDAAGGDIALADFDGCKAVKRVGPPNAPRYMLDANLEGSVVAPIHGLQHTLAAEGDITAVPGGGMVGVVSDQQLRVFTVQALDARGAAAGGPVTITLPERGGLVPLAGGGYAAYWLTLLRFERFSASTYVLWTQTFTATGEPVGSPLRVDEEVRPFQARPAVDTMPRIAGFADGGYVLAWVMEVLSGSDLDFQLRAQRFSASGAVAAPAIEVAPDVQGYLGVTPLVSGGYLVTWAGFARAFSAEDTALGPAQPVAPPFPNPSTGDTPPPAVVSPMASGGAVIVWASPWGLVDVIRSRPLAPDASAAGPAALVDDDSHPLNGRHHRGASTAGLPDNSYIVTWAEGGEVYARRFAGDGTPLGAETRIDQDTTHATRTAAIALTGGRFTIAWNAEGPDGIRRNYARTFGGAALLGGT